MDETEITMELSPPRCAGLRVDRLLGIGGRSAVWQVRRNTTDHDTITWVHGGDELPERLALKVPLSRPRCVPAVHSAVSELEAMLPLRHTHLVRAWGLAVTDAGTGILVDCMPVGSLASVLHTMGELSPGQMVTVFTPVAQAVAYLHAQGASHGDISLANILLSAQGMPALGDLGDAQLLGMPAAAAAPEQDLHDLGVAIWEALTGDKPGSAVRRAPLRAVRPDAPIELVDLLEDMLHPQPEKRPTAADCASELYACADSEPLELHAYVDDEVLAELPTVTRASAGVKGSALQRCGAFLSARRRAFAGVAAGAVLLGSAWVWWDTGGLEPVLREARGHQVTSVAAAHVPEDPLEETVDDPLGEALDVLAELRTAALAEPDPGLADTYTVPGSPAQEAERQFLAQLADAGQAYSGAPLQFTTDQDAADQDVAAIDGATRVPVTVEAETYDASVAVSQLVWMTLEEHHGQLLLYAIETVDTGR